ncbi:LEAF RUST 10 DISEASE-RESISTANCE LOCUS RECEPTOR-LIKE PROTEIN KINASE-like 2.1 isoform X2 [Vitis riparia]|uniref:LEAF RUST 10 DISEASE-RESISTANCE LOCUS RECEPTOR-LIKE PROTEIN KINASE-like 2.1 isoform X2 n=1 Tax=Vitis riparia TaxID=96939 RepID=UPI00155A5592|nr:LEAF RUST 10 DISEASE-RESISTANCE LOCUS RECEPTOR-LIKE PROTEIN KINASE-like 2.1 isoform X2 [Vitis riparia]
MEFLFSFILPWPNISIHSSLFLIFFYHFTSMHLKDFFPSSLVISLFISILSHAFPIYVCGIDFRYATCNSSAECGRLGKIHYPFWVKGSQPWYCGYPWFGLNCHKDEATMWIWFEPFHVIDMDDRTQTLKIARIHEPSTGNFFCPVFNASRNSTSFSYSSDVEFITFLHNCPPIEGLSSYEYPCVVLNKTQIHSYFVANTSLASRYRSRCGYSVLLPVLASAAEGLAKGSLDVGEALSKGFEVKWTANETQCEGCMESGGRCGYDLNRNTPSCFCRDQPYPESCSRSSTAKLALKNSMLTSPYLLYAYARRLGVEYQFLRNQTPWTFELVNPRPQFLVFNNYSTERGGVCVISNLVVGLQVPTPTRSNT